MFTHSNLNGGSHRTAPVHSGAGVRVFMPAVRPARFAEVMTINTYLPKSYAEYKLLPNGPAHMGVGTAEVPVAFNFQGATYRATRVAFASDFKSYIGLTLDGGPVLASGARLRFLVRVPVAPWSPESLTLAFAVVAAHAVAMDLRAPLHSRPSWQTAIGTISNLVPNAVRADVNAALATAGATFSLAVGTVTNARVRGGSGGTVMYAAGGPATAESLAALLAPKSPPTAPEAPKSPPKSAPKS
jgi:hypothetical protein